MRIGLVVVKVCTKLRDSLQPPGQRCPVGAPLCRPQAVAKDMQQLCGLLAFGCVCSCRLRFTNTLSRVSSCLQAAVWLFL